MTLNKHKERYSPGTTGVDTNQIGASYIHSSEIVQNTVNLTTFSQFGNTDPSDYSSTTEANSSYNEYDKALQSMIQLKFKSPFVSVSHSISESTTESTTDVYTISPEAITVRTAEVNTDATPNQNKVTEVSKKLAPISISNGVNISFIIPTTNTKTAINIAITLYDGTVVTKAIKKYTSGTLTKTNLVSGEMLRGTVANLIYDGTDFVLVNGSSASYVIGQYMEAAFITPQIGWLLCDGMAVSRTTYSGLFAVIGTAFGAGDGTTTFNLPDPRGRVSGTAGQGSGLTNRTIGTKVGMENVTLDITQIPAHSHTVSQIAGSGGTGEQYASGTFRFPRNQETSSSGGGQAHVNMQPTEFNHYKFIYAGV